MCVQRSLTGCSAQGFSMRMVIDPLHTDEILMTGIVHLIAAMGDSRSASGSVVGSGRALAQRPRSPSGKAH